MKINKLKLISVAGLLLGLLAAGRVDAALLYSGAANQVVYQDETFIVEWYLDTQDDTVNTIYLKLNFSKENLQVTEVSAGDSVINLWVKNPEFSNDDGTISFIGGISSGAKQSKLPLFRTTFRPTILGNAKISMDESSTVLLSDGSGTAASLLFKQMSFAVVSSSSKPAQIHSSSHPNPDLWYQNNSTRINVDVKSDEIYSYSFSSNIELIPDEKADDVGSELIFQNLEDGIYYFKLNSKIGSANWQEAGVYRVKVDKTAPVQFKPAITKDPAVFEGTPFISFNTRDNASGISHYEIKTGPFSRWTRVADSYYPLNGTVLGDKVEIKVVDNAGNEQVSSVKIDRQLFGSPFSNWFFWFIILLSIFLMFSGVWLYLKLLKKYTIK